MRSLTANLKAPAEGRWWWEWTAVVVCALSVGVTLWMGVASGLHALPLTGGALPDGLLPERDPLLYNVLVVADTLAGAGLLLLAGALFRAVLGTERTIIRGLMVLLAATSVAGAAASAGSLVILAGDPYYWRLVALRLLRGYMATVTAVEFLLHLHYVRAAFVTPTPTTTGQTPVEAMRELRDMAQGDSRKARPDDH